MNGGIQRISNRDYRDVLEVDMWVEVIDNPPLGLSKMLHSLNNNIVITVLYDNIFDSKH